MGRMREAVLAVLMNVQSGQDRRATRAAGRDIRERVAEARALTRETIEVRRARICVAVASELQSKVIGDQQQDVLLWRLVVRERARRSSQQCQDKTEQRERLV